MLKKILLAIDGSEQGMKAADYAIRLAQIQGGEVEIIYVVPESDRILTDDAYLDPVLGLRLKEQAAKALKEAGEKILAQGKAKFQDTGVSHTTKLMIGDPAEEILQEAEKQNVDVIVMGSRGLSGLTRFVLGSVSNKVVSHAKCSVFIVR